MRVLFPALLALGFVSCGEKSPPPPGGSAEAAEPPPLTDPHTLSPSSSCAHCHKDIHESWSGSHHGLAHRDTGDATDAEAFAEREVTQGTAKWKFSGGADKPEIDWQDGEQEISGKPPMAIGYTPLVQYLLATGDGRYQVPDMAWDPEKKEWFSIYGDQDRRPVEWGHWSQRGMNWNSQCAPSAISPGCGKTTMRRATATRPHGSSRAWAARSATVPTGRIPGRTIAGSIPSASTPPSNGPFPAPPALARGRETFP